MKQFPDLEICHSVVSQIRQQLEVYSRAKSGKIKFFENFCQLYTVATVNAKEWLNRSKNGFYKHVLDLNLATVHGLLI